MNLKCSIRPLILAALAFFSLAGLSGAQTKLFMYSIAAKASLKGGTTHAIYKEKAAAEILSFGLEAANTVSIGGTTGGGGAGKASFEALTVQFIGEPEMMPFLFQMLTTGQHIADLVIDEASTDALTATKAPFLRIDTRLVIMERLQVVGTQGDRTIYNATFRFGAMEMSTWKMDNTGELKPASSYRWSVVKNNNSLNVN